MTGRQTPIRPGPLALAGIAGSLLLAGCSFASAALPAEGRVAVSITPGKPGAPTETVTVSWGNGKALLRSERRAEGGETLAAGEAGLDGDRLRELWQAVERNRLTEFKASEAAGQVFDFGTRSVRLEWAPRAGQARQAHAFSWIKPLDNEARVQPLLRAAAEAARAAVPGVPLAYFPAPPSRP